MTHKANGVKLDRTDQAKVNYEPRLPKVPMKTKQRVSDTGHLRKVTYEATKWRSSYDETLMQKLNEDDWLHEH